jgi:hypothetical protein
MDIIELEQDIVTGVNSDAGVVSNKDIFNKFSKLPKDINEDDLLRLILTLHSCIDITEKDFKMISDRILDVNKRSVFNLEHLGKFKFNI